MSVYVMCAIDNISKQQETCVCMMVKLSDYSTDIVYYREQTSSDLTTIVDESWKVACDNFIFEMIACNKIDNNHINNV